MVMEQPTLLLASSSPRRRQLLALGGWTFSTQSADIDESLLPGEAPQDYVLRLAETKARALGALAEPGCLVVAADTIVVDGLNGNLAGDPNLHHADQAQILGKPADVPEAADMLRRLRGHPHDVFTALAVFSPGDGRLLLDLCATKVPMREYTNEEILTYVQSGDPLDKAGAYAIQHQGFHPVEALQGCFASVMGLPLCHLVRTLRQFGVFPEVDVPGACQAALQYTCPIYTAVLNGEAVG